MKEKFKKYFGPTKFKRLFDIVVSFIALIVLSPLFLVICIANLLTPNTSVFFSHERRGRKGKPFKIYKFQTMKNNTPNVATGDLENPEQYITKVGKFLRDVYKRQVMDFAREYDVPVFIHCGHPPFSLPWSIALLAEKYPDVRVTMIHMGHGHGVYIDAAIKMAKRYDNITLEMSGMPMGSKIKEAYETVGKDRIMFGIDSPFHHPTVEIQKVLSCGLDEKAQEDVFYNNAKKLLRL